MVEKTLSCCCFLGSMMGSFLANAMEASCRSKKTDFLAGPYSTEKSPLMKQRWVTYYSCLTGQNTWHSLSRECITLNSWTNLVTSCGGRPRCKVSIGYSIVSVVIYWHSKVLQFTSRISMVQFKTFFSRPHKVTWKPSFFLNNTYRVQYYTTRIASSTLVRPKLT